MDPILLYICMQHNFSDCYQLEGVKPVQQTFEIFFTFIERRFNRIVVKAKTLRYLFASLILSFSSNKTSLMCDLVGLLKYV